MAQTSPSGARRTPGHLGRRFTRRHRRLRVGLSQLMFVVAGLVLGIFVPKTTVPPTVSSGRIVDLLFTAGVTVISLITVIYSLLFVVVQWGGERLQPPASPVPRRPDRLGGDVAAFAVRVRFFQRQGYDPATALSSGAIASTASWVAKGLLFLAAIGFAAGSFHAPESSGGDQTAIWIILGVVLAAGVAAALITVIPRLRRLATARVRPHLVRIWADLKTIASEPRKIVYVLAGSVLSQLFVALALGASLHAFGEQASISTLLVVITTASMVGGAVPVPGGAGVVEAGLIAGLTSAGVPQDQAVAAVFIQRLFTAYLPPIWGYVTLAWMRRREYV